ncbi:hypothetical protein [Halomicrococcus sp. NG-SE-24]|uniref:hypothetical protein n=1 Tax=Halomicrococcus sp. NG-SE-24 TaxID=3436928 RepID=UPI003D977B7F
MLSEAADRNAVGLRFEGLAGPSVALRRGKPVLNVRRRRTSRLTGRGRRGVTRRTTAQSPTDGVPA